MPVTSQTSPDRPSAPPGHPALSAYLDWLWREHSGRIEFAVLFGSRARGDAFEDSDYDLLLGLVEPDGLRWVDRLGVYQDEINGKVDVFPYAPEELARMEDEANLLLLESLADGVALYDRGTWRRLRERFARRVAEGRWRRIPLGWEV